jgi:hypothetical protein
MTKKLNQTRRIIDDGMRHMPRGVMCWSGGKDSMVLLDIMREMGYHIPVVFFREPWQPGKYKFHDQIIRDWQLQVVTWHPYQCTMQQNADEFEVQNYYKVNNTVLTCPTGIVEPVAGRPWVCAIDILDRPKQTHLECKPFDAVWIGHKGCDSDPILGGDVGTRIDARVIPGDATMMFPLRDWTHDDVWEYIETRAIPFDLARYERVDGKWREKENKLNNIDYVHACTRCLDRRADAPRFVECPKLGMTIENASGMVPWDRQEPLTYMKD